MWRTHSCAASSLKPTHGLVAGNSILEKLAHSHPPSRKKRRLELVIFAQQSGLAARIMNFDRARPRMNGPDFLGPPRQQKLSLAPDVPGTLRRRDHLHGEVRRAFRKFSGVLQIQPASSKKADIRL